MPISVRVHPPYEPYEDARYSLNVEIDATAESMEEIDDLLRALESDYYNWYDAKERRRNDANIQHKV